MRICLRRVRDAVHGDIRRCGKAALRLADILAHGGILACDFRQRAIAAIDGFLIFFRFSRIEERPCEVPDGGRARARSPFLRMEAGAARAIHSARLHRDADREAQRAVAAAVLDLDGEISLCLRRYVYIFFRLQRRIFRYSDGCICLRFRPAKVDRDRKIFHAALPLEIDGVTAFRRNREILLCREHTFPLDFYFRRNVRDADIDPDAESAARLTADFRLCLRGNRKVFRCGELRILDRHARVCARLHDRRQTSHLFTKGLMEQSEDAILFCTCLVRIRRADLAADFCLRGNRYILPLDGGIRNLDRSIRLTAHEISAIPFCAGDDRRVAACRVHVCLVNDDRALRLERLCHRRCADCCERNVTMTQSLRNRCRW